jgi:putative oxidoreductase
MPPDRALELLLGQRLSGQSRLARAALRLAAAGVFLAFGAYKFGDHLSEVSSLRSYGLPFADQLTYAIGVVEMGGGLLLATGLLARLAALALAGDMVGAIATAGRVEGGPIHLGLAPALLAAMLFLVWAGPGRWALDDRLLALLRGRFRPRVAAAARAGARPLAS